MDRRLPLAGGNEPAIIGDIATREWRQQVIEYVEKCHLEDGGYFFAQVAPSNCRDTYFATESLRLLGTRPRNLSETVGFLVEQSKMNRGWGFLFGAFFITQSLRQLECSIGWLSEEYAPRILRLQDAYGGFGQGVYLINVFSELENTYMAVESLKALGVTGWDESKVIDFALAYMNRDGGFGEEGHSNLISTYYATEILALLGYPLRELARLARYLREKEHNWDKLYFLDEIFFLISAQSRLGQKPLFPEAICDFVLQCQRRNGGFARATPIGISTLESTYHALAILSQIDALSWKQADKGNKALR
jgi:hypothetical protein